MRLATLAALCASLSLGSAATVSAAPKGGIAQICSQAGAARPGAKRFTLPQLLARAKAATKDATAAAVQAADWDRWRAKWAWTPKISIKGLFAPSPSIKCTDAPGIAGSCVTTSNPNLSGFIIDGVFGRISADLAMPIYTFGKISAAKRAAEAGVAAAREQGRRAQGDLELQVVRAYWGLKTAREIVYTVCDGRRHILTEQARIEKKLKAQEAADDADDDEPAPVKAPPAAKKGKQDAKPAPAQKSDDDDNVVVVTDLQRIKTFLALIDTRLLEAVKLERFTRGSLALLAGVAPEHFDIDEKILHLVDGKLLPVAAYGRLARRHRPEARLLDAAFKARQAALSLEKAQFLPNLLIVASGVVAGAQGVDDPQNAFYSDPFNVLTGGFGLALSWNLDPVQQYGKYRAARARAAALRAQKALALKAIDVDLRQAYEDLREARERLAITQRAQRAVKAWLTATVQNLAAGLAKPSELTDVLPKYFELKLKHVQAIYDVNFGWAKLARSIGTAARRSEQPASAPAK